MFQTGFKTVEREQMIVQAQAHKNGFFSSAIEERESLKLMNYAWLMLKLLMMASVTDQRNCWWSRVTGFWIIDVYDSTLYEDMLLIINNNDDAKMSSFGQVPRKLLKI